MADPAHDPIKHVILLMFENHSFDQMLGALKEVIPDLNGIDTQNPGVNRDDKGQEFRQVPTTERQMLLDPHHEVNHVRDQMADHNGGFVLDFAKSFPSSTPQDRQFIMGYYPVDFLPALHRLAREFTICDRWFSSLPGPTWPNRFFALTGTSNGRVNMPEDGEHTVDFLGWFQQDQTTVFDRLTEQGISWKVYFHDIPQTVCLTHQRLPENAARYFPISEFFKDTRGLEGDFPAFSFIEPDFNGFGENDDHPPHDVMKAQKLLADVYNAIRSHEQLWNSTLLVVLYDEHGGFYDHVEPPDAIPPDDHHEEYDFKSLGIRVPVVLVSPWVGRAVDHTQFDHTSLLKYLTVKWSLGPLGNRTADAKSIGPLICMESARTGTLNWIELTPDQLRSPDPDKEEDAAVFISGHHKALALIAHYLKLEAMEELPRWYAWAARLIERVKQWWRSKATTAAAIQANYDLAKGQWGEFLEQRKALAVPRLANIIRNPQAKEKVRLHAVETLAHVVGRRFHRHPDPIGAAVHWLKRHGH